MALTETGGGGEGGGTQTTGARLFFSGGFTGTLSGSFTCPVPLDQSVVYKHTCDPYNEN